MKAAGIAALVIVACLTAPARAGQQARAPRDTPAVTLPAILAIEDARAPTSSDARVLLQALRSPLRDAAIRALGRLQRRDVIPDLLPYLTDRDNQALTAQALVLALRGGPLETVAEGQQEQAVLDALLAAGTTDLGVADVGPRSPIGLSGLAHAVGLLAYQRRDQFKAAESFLRQVLERPFPGLGDTPHVGAARGLEALARLNRKLGTFEDDTIGRLRTLAQTTNPRRTEHQRNALAALIAAQAVDAPTIEAGLASSAPEIRRLSVLALAGSGSVVDDNAERIAFIRRALADTSYLVRFEALRAWIRRGVTEHGCGPLVDALQDPSLHVVLAAIDALGDQCRDDGAITVLVTSEARTPPNQGRWQREAHALVALAKRDRQRAALALGTFGTHVTWQVRMYTARAAAILGDGAMLQRLASDTNDNVVEAALPPLRTLMGAESDAAFVAALRRTTRPQPRNGRARPYQVLRTAAMALDAARSTPELVNALIGALERVSAEHCETSRDTRMALLQRLAVLGSPAQAGALMPLLKDLDPVIAATAAGLITQWTGKAVEPESLARQLLPPVSATEGAGRTRVVFEMESGRTFDASFNAGVTPLTRRRFLAAVESGYYTGLTFHRVVPNFVIQGGSPNANEYCGDCPFMRDEVGGQHTRGTIGVSTRGPDTGDAQIFINLVDNPRLDFSYTVFGQVCSGMDVVDEIQEGDRMIRVRLMPPTPTCG